MTNLTWTCHVCGEERPDDKISVHSKKIHFNGVEIQTNVRYCNDKKKCREGAPKVEWIKEKEKNG